MKSNATMDWGAHLQGNFQGVRARLQRVADAKIFSGWVRIVSERTAHIEIADRGDIARGQDFLLTINGRDFTGICGGQVAMITPELVSFDVSGSMAMTPNTEASRKLVNGQEIILKVDGMPIPARMSDISRGGFGCMTEVSVPRGEIIEFEIAGGAGVIKGTAEVRYCRGSGDQYRIGFQVVHLGRIESALWQRMVA